jgi:hypothetical protein
LAEEALYGYKMNAQTAQRNWQTVIGRSSPADEEAILYAESH